MDVFEGIAGDPGSIRDLVSVIAQRDAAVRRAELELKALCGKGRGADGRVEVEVDRFGALAGLRIDPRAMRMGSQALAEAILEAAQQAAADVRTRADELIQPLISNLSSAAHSIGGIDVAAFADQDVDEVLAALWESRRGL